MLASSTPHPETAFDGFARRVTVAPKKREDMKAKQSAALRQIWLT
jgi:hypothetical protein